MSDVQLVILSSAFLSLLFSYVPGLSDAYSAKSPTFKRLVMLVLLAVVSLIVFGLSCAGFAPFFNITVACNQAGAIDLLSMFVLALTTNQAVFLLSP